MGALDLYALDHLLNPVVRMPVRYDDGGRREAGFTAAARGDCVCRAIAIATGKPYREVYDELAALGRRERTRVSKRTGKARPRSSPASGVYTPTIRRYLTSLGWEWHPTMGIGTGCTVHLRKGELPGGRLIVSVSKHIVAVIDGVIHDTHDCTRDGTRCVYGYWTPPENVA
jgi:hypothetical protein